MACWNFKIMERKLPAQHSSISLFHHSSFYPSISELFSAESSSFRSCAWKSAVKTIYVGKSFLPASPFQSASAEALQCRVDLRWQAGR
jgi:hypothetical protein